MSKKIKFIIIGVILSVVFVLVLWNKLYADEYDAYESGKFTYETVGKWGHTLADAHRYFVKANDFLDAEDYIQKIEDEMYVELKEVFRDKAFSRDGVNSSIQVLKSSTRYKDIAEDWDKQRIEHFENMQLQFERKIASNPPYVGMSSNYIDKTVWGPPTRISKNNFSYETRGSLAYYWDYYIGNIHKVKAVYVSEGKVIKVNDY